MKNIFVLSLILATWAGAGKQAWGETVEPTGVGKQPVVFSDDGGWCWFEDPRAIIHDGKLIIGTVANGRFDSNRKGDIEALIYDLSSGDLARVELHDRLQADDHNSPVFLVRPDGRLLALYAKHGPESHFYYRVSEPGEPSRWGPVKQHAPSEKTRLTYSNIYLLPKENNRIYNFFRGLDNSFKPSFVYSDDLGESWNPGAVWIDVPGSKKHRPYVRYNSNESDAIHMIYTEGHPRDYDNSIYHVFYRNGNLHQSNGRVIRSLKEGLKTPEEGTRIFQGEPERVAWTVDLELDGYGYPCAVYSVQMDSAGLPPRQGGDDLRYRYARWDGERWHDHALAYAGTRLYAGEDDYAGLAALDPNDPDVVYISSNADPVTGKPLISRKDGKRHWELFRGKTRDFGKSWSWTALTSDSVADNIRPIMAAGEGATWVVWLRGSYSSYTRYDLEVVGLEWENEK